MSAGAAAGHIFAEVWRFAEGQGARPESMIGLAGTGDLVADHPPGMVLSTLIAYLLVYVFLLTAYVLVLMYMAQHPAKPTPDAPQSPKAAMPIGGPA